MGSSEGSTVWSRRRGLVGLAATISTAVFLSARSARAHAIVVESTPTAGAEVAGSEVELMIRFNSRIDAERSRLVLERPDGSQTPLDILPSASADRLDAHLRDLTPGAYTLIWQVLSTDGHITRGTLPFSVVAP
jgi:methionine-rich copper-binding protein CopC